MSFVLSPSTRPGLIIPAYMSPTSASFNTIISAKNSHPNVPMAVILNVSEGPGPSALSAYTDLISRLNTAGIVTLGYVPTNFADTTEATVQGMITNWKTFYPTLKGIYFAQMSTSSQTYYSNLNTYAKSTRGFATTLGGAGTKPPTAYLGTCSDCVVIYEGAGVPAPTSYTEYTTVDQSRTAFLVYSTAALNASWVSQILNACTNWVYTTVDAPPNPWDVLPTYFNALVQLLDDLATGTSTVPLYDTFGIRKIYATKQAGEEWYVSMSNPTGDPRFQNLPSLTRESDGSWSCSGSASDYYTRLEAWSPAYSDSTQRINAKWRNVEITGYIKMTTEHYSAAYLVQLYSRGGHHTDNRHCEGTALKVAVTRRRRDDSDVGLSGLCRKEVCHSAYCDNRAYADGAATWSSSGYYNRWIGVKEVIYNVVESGNTYTKQELYTDPNCQDSAGNLSIQNNWKLITSYIDRGGWYANQSAFDSDCGSCGYARDRIMTAPGGNTTSSSSNYNRNLVAWRTDGIRYRWKFLTAREIDPTKPATGEAPLPPPPTEPAASFDNFGVRKVYPTRSNGDEWYLANTPSGDSRFYTVASYTRNSDQSWRIASSTATSDLQVYQPDGYNSALTAAAANNHAECAQNLYMQSVNDWRSVEITGYFRANTVGSGGSTGQIVMYGRGGKHRDPGPSCEGSAYKGFLATNGQTKFAKEQYHVAFVYTDIENQLNQSLLGKWVGMKFVLFNLAVGDHTIVKMELYVDVDNTNTWTKIDERADTGGWGTLGGQCQGAADQIIVWGGPIVGFLFDNLSSVDFQKLSVREIDESSAVPQPPPGQESPSCGA